ncbi:MAG: carbohydrate ABC transporter permease [Acidimicrobiales bacterium]
MSIDTREPGVFSPEAAATQTVGERMKRLIGSIPTWFLWLIVIIWTIPTLGLLVSSFRPVEQIAGPLSTGWWEAVLPQNWGDFTLENYDEILFQDSAGRESMWTYFLNSLAIVLPATIIPISIATFAAYGFAWMDFKGRNWLFVGLIAMMALPNQMTFIPLIQMFENGATWTIPGTDQTLKLFPDLDINGTVAAVWLTHTSFGLPLAIFLLHNYISQLPKDIFEAARIDGANHFTIFMKLVLPLSAPAIAAFGIFQFLWTWNDFLIASVFLDGDKVPMTVALVNIVGEQGQNAHLRFPAGFVTIIVPLIVFFALQKHFVRGLLAGSVKG